MYSFTSLVSVLLGLLLIYTGLTADTEDVYKDIEFVKGKITYYHLYKSINSQKFNGVIHLDTYKKDSSASKYFLFNHIEAFKKNSFERSGGGIGSFVSLGVKSKDLHHTVKDVTIYQVIFNGKKFVNEKEFIKLIEKSSSRNLWFGIFLSTVGIIGIFLFSDYLPIPNFSPLIHSLKNALLTIKWFAYANPFISIGVLLIIGYLGVPRVIDGFSSPEIIRKSCLEESKVVHRYRVGAICFDGSRSGATGRGACSWHGGVREWVYREKVEFKKTRQECMKYAIKRSWID